MVDPEIEVRPVKGQRWTICSRKSFACAPSATRRVLVTTLTKRMSEDLAEYFTETGVRCRYMHSEIDTLERVRILRDLRRGEFDTLIGINLLREGLDLPEVSAGCDFGRGQQGRLPAQRDLRSFQTTARCARHVEGRAILYADRMTGSMAQAIGETSRRRAKQVAYNDANGITPQSIIKSVDMKLAAIVEADYVTVPIEYFSDAEITSEQKLGEEFLRNSKIPRCAKPPRNSSSSASRCAKRDRIRTLKQRDLAGFFSAAAEPAPAE